MLPLILFSFFIIRSFFWVVVKSNPSFSFSVRLKAYEKIGVSLFSIFGLFRSLIGAILLFVSTQFIYFFNFFYYVSIIGIAFFGVFFLFSLFAYSMSRFAGRNPDSGLNISKIDKDMQIQKIKSGLITGIIGKIIFLVAWTKTYKFIEVPIDNDVEKVTVVFLYFFLLIYIAHSVYKSKIKKSS